MRNAGSPHNRPQLGLALGFYGRQLLGHQAQPLMLAYNLFLEVRRQPAPISAAHLLQVGNEARLERHYIANAQTAAP